MPRSTHRLSRTRRVVGVVVLAIAAAVMSPVTTARASGFYDPPAPVTGAPGTVLKTAPMTFYLDPLKAVPSTARATRVRYASRDRSGAPIAVTGTVLVPPVPWFGPGQRPLIGYAAGTQGMGDQCAPSRQLAAGS